MISFIGGLGPGELLILGILGAIVAGVVAAVVLFVAGLSGNGRNRDDEGS